jgi:kynurenine aminotransferase
LYINGVVGNGAKPIYVRLHSSKSSGDGESEDSCSWKLNPDELWGAVTERTKAIVINNPHNPTGKVWTETELRLVAEVAQKHDLLVISDEVYEFLVFGGYGQPETHIRIATLPGMWERTLTVCSAGKTFSTTGLKIGWIFGCQDLLFNCYLYQQYSVFSINTLSQRAVAKMLPSIGTHRPHLASLFRERAQLLMDILERNGMPVVRPASGYFVVADISDVEFPYNKHTGIPR